MEYSLVLNVLARVANLSNETGISLQDVMNQSALLLEANLPLQIMSFVNFSDQLFSSAQRHSSEVLNLLELIDSVVMQQIYILRKLTDLNNTMTRLMLDVTSLHVATNLATSEVNRALFRINDQVNMVQVVSTELSSSFSPTLNTTVLALKSVNETQSVSLNVLSYSIRSACHKMGLTTYRSLLLLGWC